MLFHLLIVDDEPTIRKGLSHFIAWESINCIVDGAASDGKEAMEKIRKSQPDIIITDIKMPEADGIDLSKFIFENYPWIKVIILTGYADFEYARSAIKYQVIDFILKPTSKDKLIEAVKHTQNLIIEEKAKSSIRKEDVVFLQEQLLTELTDNPNNYESIASRLAAYGIACDSYYLIALQKVKKDPEQAEQELNYIKDILKNQIPQVYCYRYTNHLILALFPAANGAGFIPPEILTACRETAEIARTLYSIELSIGISSYKRSLRSLSSASKQAISALRMNFYNDETLAVYHENANGNDFDLEAEYTLALCDIENLLKNRSFKELDNAINTLFMQFHMKFIRPEDVKNICVLIYYICSRIVSSRNAEPLAPSILADITSCNSIFELEKMIRRLMKTVEGQIAQSGKNVSLLVEQAISYIHANLRENLSLEVIAEHIHVTSSHLSRTFKKELGQSITEYITKIKIEKAQELLSCSNLMTYEIAEMVGFHDPTYFSSTFKKITGISPKEYKLLHFHS